CPLPDALPSYDLAGAFRRRADIVDGGALNRKRKRLSLFQEIFHAPMGSVPRRIHNAGQTHRIPCPQRGERFARQWCAQSIFHHWPPCRARRCAVLTFSWWRLTIFSSIRSITLISGRWREVSSSGISIREFARGPRCFAGAFFLNSIVRPLPYKTQLARRVT